MRFFKNSLKQLSPIFSTCNKSSTVFKGALTWEDKPTIFSFYWKRFPHNFMILWSSNCGFIHPDVFPMSLNLLLNWFNLILLPKLESIPAIVWLDRIHLCTAPVDILIPIIPPTPLYSLLTVCSITCSIRGKHIECSTCPPNCKITIQKFKINIWMGRFLLGGPIVGE